jgi:hypothetical protein
VRCGSSCRDATGASVLIAAGGILVSMDDFLSRLAFVHAGAILMFACASTPPSSSSSSSPPPAEPPGRAAKLVSTTVVANECAAVNKAFAKPAEAAMSKLTEDCARIPGGSMRFTANLLPGGRIELLAADGGPEVVPICVLKHELTHKVPLTKACRLDVRLDESTTMIATPDAGAD